MMTERDQINIKNTERRIGREEGRAEGRAEGREEGLNEGFVRTAKNMKAIDIPVETIAQVTGLSPEVISKL